MTEPQTRKLNLRVAAENIDDVLLAHAERQWQAECENAARQSSRANLILSATSVILALPGLIFLLTWRDGNRFAADSGTLLSMQIVAFVFIAIAAFLFVLCLITILGVRSARKDETKHPPMSSAYLDLKGADLKLALEDRHHASRIAFTKLRAAGRDLHRRNVRQKQRMDESQQWLVYGLFALVLGLGLYGAANVLSELGATPAATGPENAEIP